LFLYLFTFLLSHSAFSVVFLFCYDSLFIFVFWWKVFLVLSEKEFICCLRVISLNISWMITELEFCERISIYCYCCNYTDCWTFLYTKYSLISWYLLLIFQSELYGIFAIYLLELYVLLGRLGRQQSYLTVSLPSSPRSLTPTKGFSQWPAVRSGHRRRWFDGCDAASAAIRHLSAEGSSDLSCSVFWL